MGLDFNALAENAYELAKGLAPQAFRTVDLQLGPTMDTYSSTNDTKAVDSWDFDSTATIGLVLKAMPFDDEKERRDQPIEARLKTWLFSMDDLTGVDDLALSSSGEITDKDETPNVVWKVYRVEVDPSKSVVLFYTRS